jgi:hypothetical protein
MTYEILWWEQNINGKHVLLMETQAGDAETPVTLEELNQALALTKNQKAIGLDEIMAELVKYDDLFKN